MTDALSRMIERVQTGRSDVLPRRAARFEPEDAGAEPIELGPVELGPTEPEPAQLGAREPVSRGGSPRNPAAGTPDAAARSGRATAAAWPESPTPPASPAGQQTDAEPSPPPDAAHGADHAGLLHEVETLVRQAATTRPTPPAEARPVAAPPAQTDLELDATSEPRPTQALQPWSPAQPIRSEPRGRASVQEPASPSAEPAFNIEIGRIEIIAPPRAPERKAAPRRGPRLDLEGYLSARRKGER